VKSGQRGAPVLEYWSTVPCVSARDSVPVPYYR